MSARKSLDGERVFKELASYNRFEKERREDAESTMRLVRCDERPFSDSFWGTARVEMNSS